MRHQPAHMQPYSRYRPTAVAIPRAEFQARAAELLREAGETDAGRVVFALIGWGRRQVEVERSAEPQRVPSS